MYERFYQLRERPFALSPDPEYLYPSRVHQEALDHLRYGLETQAGFIVITGEIGSGKTTLLQAVLRTLDNHTTVGRIVNTMLEPRELLESILIDFGLDPEGKSKPLLLRDLSQYLVDQRLAGRLVLVVIDEAQNLSLNALEELRMLSNLETEKSKLMQIVLVGQTNLRDKLGAGELEQLRQRITVSYHLPPLDAQETHNYINHRLRHAAIGVPLQFPRDATDRIHRRSGGVPRVINVICDAALVFGYAEDRRSFDAATIEDVLQELETTGVLPPQKSVEAAGARTATAPAPAVSAAPRPAAVPAAFAEPSTVPLAAAKPAAVHSAKAPTAPPPPAFTGPATVPITTPPAASAGPATAPIAPRPAASAAPATPPIAQRPAAFTGPATVPLTAAPPAGSRPATASITPPPAASTAPATAPIVQRPAAYTGPATVANAPAPPVALPRIEPVAVATMGPDLRQRERERELEQRERLVRQREEELAEQRRVLAEEYRLLRVRRSAEPPAVDAMMAQRFQTESADSFWTRVKRFMLGVSTS